uniref:Uncharacterized protein n=2 Tax=Strongyloides stercoralis TaxID=6248 RepID=A0AAF5HY62_STRER
MESFTISFPTMFVGLLMITTILICSCCYCTDIWLTKKHPDSYLNTHNNDEEKKIKNNKSECIENCQKTNINIVEGHSCCKHLNPLLLQNSFSSIDGHNNSNGVKQNWKHNYTKIKDCINNSGSMWKCSQEEGNKCNTTSTCLSNCSKNSHTISSSIATTPNTNHPLLSRTPSPLNGSQKNILPAVILPIPCLMQNHLSQNCDNMDSIYNTRDYYQLVKLKKDTDIGVSAV